MLLKQTTQQLKDLKILHPQGYYADWIDPEYSDELIAKAFETAVSVNDFYDVLYYGKVDELADTLTTLIGYLHQDLTKSQAHQLARQIPIRVNPQERRHYLEYFYPEVLQALDEKLKQPNQESMSL